MEGTGPSPEELGIENSLVGPENWDSLKEEGWELATNFTTASHSRPGELNSLITGLKEKYGAENVKTGNAFDKETETPSGIRDMVGIYIRKTEQN